MTLCPSTSAKSRFGVRSSTPRIPLLPSAPKSESMGPEPSRWCKYQKVKGHHTNDCYQVKREIVRLIYEDHTISGEEKRETIDEEVRKL